MIYQHFTWCPYLALFDIGKRNFQQDAALAAQLRTQAEIAQQDSNFELALQQMTKQQTMMENLRCIRSGLIFGLGL